MEYNKREIDNEVITGIGGIQWNMLETQIEMILPIQLKGLKETRYRDTVHTGDKEYYKQPMVNMIYDSSSLSWASSVNCRIIENGQVAGII